MTTSSSPAGGADLASPAQPDLFLSPVTDEPEQLRAGGTVLAAVAAGAVVAVGAAGTALSWQLGLGRLGDPGSGMWPFVLGVAMTLTGLALLLRARTTTDTERFTRGTVGVVLGAASLVAFGLLFELVGFEIPTALLLVVWLKVIGSETWRSTAVITLGAVAALHLGFVGALSVNLPHLIAW
ncbi:tripartite tricarboxylate transporter TctB family protein [Georgenia sp. AZ-5]|uniref:tripartite tricarboxylate transporter TctB family protein n=1 Tax=Georgenia sp. AZ-5 TaxID=3367526 RepID=UPI00375451F9